MQFKSPLFDQKDQKSDTHETRKNCTKIIRITIHIFKIIYEMYWHWQWSHFNEIKKKKEESKILQFPFCFCLCCLRSILRLFFHQMLPSFPLVNHTFFLGHATATLLQCAPVFVFLQFSWIFVGTLLAPAS